MLTQEKLQRALFPIGDYPKSEVRRMAEAFGLPSASRKDSQDLCFLAGDDDRHFIQRNAAETLKAGMIVTREGRVVGVHHRLANYTIGQRKGLGISSPVPLYVLGKDAGTNTLLVGEAEELGSRELTARDINWISGELPAGLFPAEVKIRYTAKEAKALVTPIEGGTQARVWFDSAIRDITPGQAAVFYQGDLMRGGGIIQ